MGIRWTWVWITFNIPYNGHALMNTTNYEKVEIVSTQYPVPSTQHPKPSTFFFI